VLVEHLGFDESDAELARHVEFLRTPVTLTDPVLGTFTLDRRLDRFTTDVTWNGSPVSLNLSVSAKVDECLRTARSLSENQTEWDERIREFVVKKLLPLKNDTWLEEGEAALTSKEFENRLSLDVITSAPDGAFDFWFDDGDMFWGHAIEVWGTLAEGAKSAHLAG
jgi:hypothetical protein